VKSASKANYGYLTTKNRLSSIRADGKSGCGGSDDIAAQVVPIVHHPIYHRTAALQENIGGAVSLEPTT
jgi:hypothetical protein